MPDIARIQLTLPYSSGTSYGPYAQNTVHVAWSGIAGGDFAQAATDGRQALINMFNTTGADADHQLSDYMSDFLTGEMQFRAWDLNNPTNPGEDGPPATLTPQSVGGRAMPTQVAACISSQCAPQTGWARQSTYNRIFIGPLNINALDSDGTGRPDPDFRNALVGGFQAYYDTFDDLITDRTGPVVYSTKHGDGFEVQRWWTDDVFDIQRRRALDVTLHDTHIVT